MAKAEAIEVPIRLDAEGENLLRELRDLDANIKASTADLWRLQMISGISFGLSLAAVLITAFRAM